MSGMDPTHMSLSQRVLDAATQLDKRLRDEEAPLDKVSAVVDLLSDPELRGDLLFQHDLWLAVQKLGSRPSTVDQLNQVIGRELGELRASLDGDTEAAGKGLGFCLALHEVVMRRGMRADWRAPSSSGFAA